MYMKWWLERPCAHSKLKLRNFIYIWQWSSCCLIRRDIVAEKAKNIHKIIRKYWCKQKCLSLEVSHCVSPASHVLSSYIGNASPRLIGAIVGWTIAFSNFSKEQTHNVVMRMFGCASVRVSWCLFSIHHAMLILENLSLWMSVNEILTAHKQTASSPVSFELCCVSDTTMIELCAYTHFSHTIFSLFVLMLLHTQQNRLLPKKVRLSSHRIW